MKVLFVNGHMNIGGVEKSLTNILKVIDYSQYQVDLLLVEDLGVYLDEIPPQVHLIYYDLKPTYGSFCSVLKRALKEKNFSLVRQKISITASNKINKKFLSYIGLPKELQVQYDCAIAYRVGMPLDLVSYAINAKVKCAWWHHGEFNYSKSLIKSWDEAFSRVDHIVCVSESSKDLLESHFPRQETKMCVLPNMILPEEVRREAEAFDPYRKEETRKILVSVSRMSVEKHVVDTIEVMRKLKRRGYNNLIWYLVGDGAERKTIEEKIKKYKLQNQFCLVGNQANPYPYIKKADIFVHPSWVESQGICVLEAMALQKSCVVVRSSGIEEYIVDGHNAILAEQSVDDLVEKIDNVIQKNFIWFSGQDETINAFTPDAIMPSFYKMIS